jgi:hypothetical protein
VTEQQSSKPESDEEVQFIEPHTHSFILKLWLLKQEGAKGGQNWRGHITHVASNQRIYFDSFLELNNLLSPYLEKMGVKLPFWWRAYRWLKQ